jgi:Major Facilitator Superfamily
VRLPRVTCLRATIRGQRRPFASQDPARAQRTRGSVILRLARGYGTLGVLVGGGGNCLGYAGQSLYLPNWFVRRRGLAMSLAFSGVGVGSIVLLPWLQATIARTGWRTACWALGLLVLPGAARPRAPAEARGPGSPARRRRHAARPDRRGPHQRRGRGLGRRRLDACAGDPDEPLLVAPDNWVRCEAIDLVASWYRETRRIDHDHDALGSAGCRGELPAPLNPAAR